MKRLLALALLFPLALSAQIPDPQPNTYVNDYAKVLDVGKTKVLNDSILALEKRSSVQLAIVLVDKLPEGMEMSDYAREIGRKWRVGNAHNGLVYVAAISQRKMRLEVAENLEGDIPDITAGHITDAIKPYMKAGDYDGAMMQLFQGIKERVDPVAKEQLAIDAKDEGEVNNSGLALTVCGIILAIFGVFWFSAWRRRKEEQEAKKAYQEHLSNAEKERQRIQKQHDDHWAKYERERQQREQLYIQQQQRLREQQGLSGNAIPPKPEKKKEKDIDDYRTYVPPYIPDTPSFGSKKKDDDDSYSSRKSSDDNSSSFGNWGSGNSDSSDSSSGFSGGGSDNSW